MSHTPKEFAELMQSVRDGDEAATAILWENYIEKLMRLAAQRLPANLRRVSDEEDVALSAFHSFIQGVRANRFPDLSHPDNLWGLLIRLLGRKVTAQLRFQTRKKRGGGKVRGESVFVDPASLRDAGIASVAGQQASGDLQAELAEQYEALLNQLPDEQLRQIALMRMEGFLVDEISGRLQLSKRAVERRLHLIRKTWAERLTKEDEDLDY